LLFLEKASIDGQKGDRPLGLAHDQNGGRHRQPTRHRPYDLSGAGLTFRDVGHAHGVPKFFRDHVIAPVKTFGAGKNACLNLSFWHASVEHSPQASDPSFVSASLRTSKATAWRNKEPSGVISMLPFEGAHWRFEQPVSFAQVHVPFDLMRMVSSSLYDRDLAHDDLNMPADVRDAQLRTTLETIRRAAAAIEPTNLLLDSWALILAEALLRRLSTHGERDARTSFGELPSHRTARVIDYIEAGIDQDLRLPALANVAAMSMYDFARRFKETLGISPHAYVLSRRIAWARAMLTGRENLANVALACGFSSQSHLTTVFRQSLGVTPGAYRRSAQ
jgi:AraC family transcriptional regulator